MLLKAGATVNSKNEDRRTALLYTLAAYHQSVADLAHRVGVVCTSKLGYRQTWISLSVCCHHDHEYILRMLLGEGHTMVDGYDLTRTLLVQSTEDHTDAVTYILKYLATKRYGHPRENALNPKSSSFHADGRTFDLQILLKLRSIIQNRLEILSNQDIFFDSHKKLARLYHENNTTFSG